MSLIKGNSTYEGMIEIGGKLACESCKTIGPECRYGMHVDCDNKFINTYTCKCGNIISISTKRTGEGAKYWR